MTKSEKPMPTVEKIGVWIGVIVFLWSIVHFAFIETKAIRQDLHSSLNMVREEFKESLKELKGINKNLTEVISDNKYQNLRIGQNEANIQILNHITQDNKVLNEQQKILIDNNTQKIKNFDN